ncbi:hypothetical protein D3C81_639640 [compost metagenome]
MAFEGERFGQHGEDLARHAGHLRAVVGRFDDDDEFVAADAADDVGGAQDGHQTLGNELEQLVAAMVAQGVVDDLEVVQVQQQQARAAVLAVGARQRVGQRIVEFMPVRQLRDRVDVGQVVQMVFRVLGGDARAAHHQHRQAERAQDHQQGEGGKLRQAAVLCSQAGAQEQGAAARQGLEDGGVAREEADLRTRARRGRCRVGAAARKAGERCAIRIVEQCLLHMRRRHEGGENLLCCNGIVLAQGHGGGGGQHVGLDLQAALQRGLQGKPLEQHQQQAGAGQHGRRRHQVQPGYPVAAQLRRRQRQWRHHDPVPCRPRPLPPRVYPPRPAMLYVPV